jgi:peroxiredoxin
MAFAATVARAAESGATPVGQKLENFSLPNTHGQAVSLSDFSGKVVVLAFLGTECPLAKNYAPRLRDLAAEFAPQGVAFLAIDSNVQDSLSEMAVFAQKTELTVPLLKDNNSQLADQLGAVRTPEVFLLDKDRVVRYWGRIDDQYGQATGTGYARPKLTARYLADAIAAVLDGHEVAQPVVSAIGCHIGRVSKVVPHGDVTYSKQVARVIQDRCVTCHRKDEVAPFTLSSYEDAVCWSETIREVVDEARMPPWFADPRYGHFANDARLTPEEKQVLLTWIDNGCPQGDPKDLPAPRTFVDGWQIGEPDEVHYMADAAFKLPAEGVLPYQVYTVDPGWTTDKWIQSAECRPSNRAVVHHILVTPKAPPGKSSSAPPFTGIAGYAPGGLPMVCPPGTATFVPAGSKLVFQMHYTPNGVAQEDRSMVGIKFVDPATVKKLLRSSMVMNLAIRIPPGDPDYEMKAKKEVRKDFTLLELAPHMHVRGKSFKFEADYPDGTHEVLLDVPHYDFNWQLRYILSEPKLIPKGTWLHTTAHFDNSANNPANPDPAREVRFGEQTWDEMMIGIYSSIDPKEDLTATATADAATADAATADAAAP